MQIKNEGWKTRLMYGFSHPINLLILAVIFVTSRLTLILGEGVSMSGELARAMKHLLQLNILRDNLARGLYHLHIQPPGQNFIVGISLKLGVLFQLPYIWILYTIQMVFGLLVCVCIYYFIHLYTRNKWLALGAAVFFAFSPALILYEAWPLYAVITALLIISSCYFLTMYLKNERMLYLVIGSVLVGILVLTRSSYQHVTVLVMGGLLFLVAKNKKSALWFLGITMVIILPWYFKNLFLFGQFSTSTISGINLYRMITKNNLDEESLAPVRTYDAYPKDFNLTLTSPYPELGDKEKVYPEFGEVYINLNNLNIIRLSEICMERATATFKKTPLGYFRNMTLGYVLYWNPSSQPPGLGDNYPLISTGFYEKVIFAGISVKKYFPEDNTKNLISRNPEITIPGVVFTVFMVYLVGLILYQWIVKKRLQAFLNENALYVFPIFFTVYNTAAGTLFELNENARFKFDIEALLLVLAVGLVYQFVWQKVFWKQ